jgi:hypothetical protein
MLWAQGMNSCLAFGLTALTAYTQAGYGRVRGLTSHATKGQAIMCSVTVMCY